MNEQEILERFFSLEKAFKDKSNKMLLQGFSLEEVKESTKEDIDVFTSFAYSNSEIISKGIKNTLKELLDNDKMKSTEVIFLYLLITTFNLNTLNNK